MKPRREQIEEACDTYRGEMPLTAFGFHKGEIEFLLSALRDSFIAGAQWADANHIKDPDRCKHDIHGYDCFDCYPNPTEGSGQK